MAPVSLSPLLVAQTDQVFFGPAWHGPTLWPTLNKLTARAAHQASPFEGFSAWGVALHTAYWKHRGGLLLAKNSRGIVAWPSRLFRGPADWPQVPAALVLGVASRDAYHTAQIRNMGIKEF